jgi:lipoprotein-releasing system permease protein
VIDPIATIACETPDRRLASGIKKRSFSLLLARRYLNPRRSVLSSFSLISLLGVMLGVLVLVVVMSVYSGLERNVKKRLLDSTPHILLSQNFATSPDGSMEDWEEIAKKAKTLPHVEAATPYVSDNVILDVGSMQRPVFFSGVDTSDPVQLQGLAGMLDLEHYPTSTANLGLDDRAVISSLVAAQYHLRVGDKIRLLSTRNLNGVMQAYKSTENPPIREAFAEVWKKSTETLNDSWKAHGDHFTLSLDAYRDSYQALLDILNSDIRMPEQDLLANLLNAMDTAEKTDTGFIFTTEAKNDVEKAVTALNATDAEKMDAETLKNLKTLVLPKEAEVIGVYQASQMTNTPDIFIPIPLAQGLAGLGTGVQGISLRLDDPYKAEIYAREFRKTLGPDYTLITWGERYQAFFSLIEQQRGMMYFMLSFIILISAFSMMAVMFTFTIQKRREIGVMKALGAAPNQIVRVFLYQGMILGTLGAILGVGLGRVVIHFRGLVQLALRQFGFDPFTSSFTGFDVLPAFNDPVEQFKFAFMAFVLCSLAALVPAFFAARSDAAKSLRNL